MATQQCFVCNLNPDAEFFLTDRHVYPDVDILPQPVIAVCMDCLINLGREWEKARLAAIESAPDSVGAGVLEQIESDEGVSPITSSSGSPKRRKKTDSEQVNWEPEAEAEATNVDG